MKGKSLPLHPLVLFGSVWLGVLFLYLMRLSKVLIATDEEILHSVALILVPSLVVIAGTGLFFFVAPKVLTQRQHLMTVGDEAQDLATLKRRLRKWLVVWAVISAVEVIVSGGVPLFWLVLRIPKTYFDFGIQSLHGLVNSLILALGLSYAGIFAKYGGRRYLLCSAGIVAWSILLITRSMMMVCLIQAGMVLVLYRGIPARLAVKIVASALLIVVGFGIIGDARSGAVNFRELAQPTASYPDWLPSGVLWVYIYLTTPLNNLTYTVASVRPANNLLFPNTAAPLFPSVIRSLVYSDASGSYLSGELVDSAFNVSTAFVGPFEDYGAAGIIGFSAFISWLSLFYWRRINFRDQLIYVVLAQCLVLSVFYNHFFSLPIITQIGWIYLFFLKGSRGSRKLLAAPLQTSA